MPLSSQSIDWAILHLDKVGDSDLFPRPAELDAVLALKDDTKDWLSREDLAQLFPRPARRFIVPKDNLSFRRATQLNLLDSIILTAIIHEHGHLIEQRRRDISEDRVFSYRFKPDQDGWLYDRNYDWTPFWSTCSDKAMQYSHALVLDISDFYNQIYHHTVENQLIEAGLPNQANKWVLQLLESLTAKVSHGIPVGPHAAHLLAEASLIPVDNSLVSQGIDYLRYVDDLIVFANSEVEARKHLYRIADVLDKQQRLVFNRQKTQLLSSQDFQAYCKEMIEDRPINDIEGQLLKIIRNYSGGNPYQTVLLSQISQEDMTAFNQNVLEIILNEYLSREPIDFVRLRWFLRRLTQVGHPGAILFCLSHLDSLTPTLADVCHYLLSASINYQAEVLNLVTKLHIISSDVRINRRRGRSCKILSSQWT